MTSPGRPPRLVRSVEDGGLEARVVRRRAMRYTAGADPSHDRPEHVRAASGLAWVREKLAVIQDDTSFVALVDPATGLAESFPLPAGPGGVRQFDDARGNKAGKLDLEAIATVPSADGVLLAAFGSGSLAPREVVALIGLGAGGAASIGLHEATRFYALLRSAAEFAGSEMNVEGALHAEGALTLFGRGNGAAVGDLRPVNASCEVHWSELVAHLRHPEGAGPPTPSRITQYDLGMIDTVALGFTDVSQGPRGAILYAAAAEASPDATRDGEVVGSVLGVLDAGGHGGRWTRLTDEAGRPFTAKVEGVTLDTHRTDRVFAVVDTDDHACASELLEVRLTGPWWADPRH